MEKSLKVTGKQLVQNNAPLFKSTQDIVETSIRGGSELAL